MGKNRLLNYKYIILKIFLKFLFLPPCFASIFCPIFCPIFFILLYIILYTSKNIPEILTIKNFKMLKILKDKKILYKLITYIIFELQLFYNFNNQPVIFF